MLESSAKSAPTPPNREEPLRAAVEQMGFGIAQVALEGKWLMVNQRLCEILGYSKEELPLISFQKYFSSPESQSDARKRERLLADEISSYTIEHRVIRGDGVPISLRTAFSKNRDEKTGQVLGLLLLVEEMTLLANAEQQHREFASD